MLNRSNLEPFVLKIVGALKVFCHKHSSLPHVSENFGKSYIATSIKMTKFGATSFGIMTLRIMTFSTMALGVKHLFLTLSIADIQDKRHSE